MHLPSMQSGRTLQHCISLTPHLLTLLSKFALYTTYTPVHHRGTLRSLACKALAIPEAEG